MQDMAPRLPDKPRRQDRPDKPAMRPDAYELVAWGAIVAYLAIFFFTDLPGLQQNGQPLTRARVLTDSLLVADELAADWFGSPPQFALADRLPVLLAAGVIAGVALLLGRLVLRGLGMAAALTASERVFFACLLGFNLISSYVLAVGLCGGLKLRWLFALPALAIVAVSAADWLRLMGNIRRGDALPPDTVAAARRLAPQPEEPADHRLPAWGWLITAVPFALLILLGGMLPPAEFDVREYHLQVPKEFFQAGRIGLLPHNVYGNMPLGAEMLSLLGMIVTGDWWIGALVGKTLIALFAPLGALGLFGLGRRSFGATVGALAALLYISVPWIARVSSSGLIDGVVAAYLLGATSVAWLVRAPAAHEAHASHEQPHRLRWLLLAGSLAGAAAACKYPAVLFVVVPLATWVFLGARRPDWRPDWKGLGVLLAAVALGGGLWYGKNLALAGNPVYPLLYGVLGGRDWSPEQDAQWRRAHRPTDFGPQAAAASLAQVGWRSPWLSPLIVPLAALSLAGVMRWRGGSAARPAARELVGWLWVYIAFGLAAWWLFTHRIDRFLLPLMPLGVLLAAVGAAWALDRLGRRAVVGLLVIGLVASGLLIAGPLGGSSHYFVSYARLRVDPERVDPWHLYLNRHVPPGYAVLAVGDAQVFDLEMPVLYRTVFNGCALEELMSSRSMQTLHRLLVERRVWAVYVHWGEIARYRSPGNYGYSNFVQPALLEQLVQAGVLAPPQPRLEQHPGEVYRVRPLR